MSYYGRGGDNRDEYDRHSNEGRRGSGGGGGGGGGGGRFPGRWDGGGGGRFGGRGGGGPPPRPYKDKETPEPIDVITNFYPIKFTKDIENMVIYQYHVEIIRVKRVKVKDADGNDVMNERNKPVTEDIPVEDGDLFLTRDKKERRMDKSTDLTRRVLLQCKQEILENERKTIYTDGTAMVISLDQLYDPQDLQEPPPAKKKKKQDKNYYGPGDDEERDNVEDDDPEAVPTKYWDYKITLLDDEEHIFNKKIHFIIRFTLSGTVVINASRKEQRLLVSAAEKMQVVNLLNTGIKNCMMRSMYTFDSKQTQFFYPGLQTQDFMLRQQDNFYRSLERNREVMNSYVTPVIGVRECVHALGNDTLYKMASFCLDWAHRKCPVLQRNGPSFSILGIHFGHNTIPPLDDEQLDWVLQKLETRQFHVEYDKGTLFVEKMKAKNLPDEKIRKYRTFKLGPLRVYKDKNPNERIRKTAYLHTFTKVYYEGDEKREVEYNVVDYYKSKGILLQHPNLPIVRTSKKEWYPIEFLYQAFTPSRHNNTKDHIDAALSFNDAHSGTDRVDHTTKMICRPGNNLPELQQSRANQDELFERLSMEVEQHPYTLRAARLKSPNLHFSRGDVLDGIEGTWNTNGKKFENPAEINSFAVINCIDRNNERSADVMSRLLRVCGNHGMKVPHFDSRTLQHLTTHHPIDVKASGPDRDALNIAITDAIQCAKNEFLYDRNGNFRNRKMFFKTYFLGDGTLFPCLVDTEHHGRENGMFGVFLQNNSGLHKCPLPHPWQPTHSVEYMGEERLARLQYMARGRFIDLFDLTDNGKDYTAVINGREEKFDYVEFGFQVYMVESGRLEEKRYEDVKILKHLAEINEKNIPIECPSIVFLLLPTTNKRTYSVAKGLCRIGLGVQSQAIAFEKYNSQKNKDMYCSGLALKVNAKLANISNQFRAWKMEGHPWIKEVKTAVIGYSMATGQNRDSKMTVAAAAVLDEGGLTISEDFGFQGRSPTVKPDVLSGLVKTMIRDYTLFNDGIPGRVILYRQGGQEGLFKEIIIEEIEAIKQGMYEALVSLGYEDSGPLYLPFVTLVVAQSQHGIHIVPKIPMGRSRNVPSGTCVDLELRGLSTLSLTDPNEYGAGDLLPDADYARENGLLFPNSNIKDSTFEFQLIPQNGLKGTSKPVYFRCIWNENFLYKKSSKCTQLGKEALKNITFDLSFQYGTATKATRLCNVLRYSERLANHALEHSDNISRSMVNREQASDEQGCILSSFREYKGKAITSFHVHQTA